MIEHGATNDIGTWELWELLATLPDGVVAADLAGTVVAANAAAADVAGCAPDDLVGRPLVDLMPVRFRARHQQGYDRWVVSGQLSVEGEALGLVVERADGREVPVTATLHQVTRGDQRLVLAFLRPTTGRTHPHSELALRLLDVVTRESTLLELLDDIMGELATHLRWDHALLWRPDPLSGRLTLAASWPEVRPGSFAGASAGYSFAPGEGHVGHAAQDPGVYWIDDLTVDADYDRAPLAREFGLHAGLFFTLVDHHEVAGVIELVTAERRGIDIATHEAVELLSHELGALIQRRSLTEFDAAQRQRLDLAVTAAGLGVWTWHQTTDVFGMSEHLSTIVGVPGESVATRDDFVRLVHPDEREPFTWQLDNALITGERFEHVYRIVLPDGSIRWMRGSGQALRDADGVIRSVTGVAVDITETIDFASEQEARVRHAGLVATIGELLTEDWLSDDILRRCAQAIVDHVDAAFARIWTLEGNELVLKASAGMYTHLDGDHARIPLGAYKIGRIAKRRRAHLTNDVQTDREISDPDWAEREGMVAFAGYPLLVAGECTGVLGMFARHELDRSTLESLGVVARMIALAGARHRAFQDRTTVAEVLQQSLLPPSLPEVPGIDLGSAYAPSIGDVSGDFFDVFPVRGEDWAVMIGDVCGKGPQAAAATALARHTLRTGAMLERGVSGPMRALNQAMLTEGGEMCTAVFALLQPGSHGTVFRFCRAGHPAPIVRRASGAVTCPVGRGGLVGVFDDFDCAEVEVDLAPGDLVVLVTDGVIEARRGREEFGEERLARLVAASDGSSSQALADEILAAAIRFDDRGQADDIAVLVLRATGS